MDLIETLGIEDLRVEIFLDKRRKDKKKYYRITAKNSQEKADELYILNSYFISFLSSNAEEVQTAVKVAFKRFCIKDSDTKASKYILNTIKHLFYDYLLDNKIEDAILDDFHRSVNIPKKFCLINAKSPHALQETSEMAASKYILVLYILNTCDLDTKSRAIFLQVHRSIIQSGITETNNISNTINIVKLSQRLLDIYNPLSMSCKNIILQNNGILRIQTRINPAVRGVYEIVNL